MKAWFIFKDGEVVGNPLGYKNKKAAKIYIDINNEDHLRLIKETYAKYGQYQGLEDIPDNLKEGSFFARNFSIEYGFQWFISPQIWETIVWEPYVKEHYKIEEREFDIVFRDPKENMEKTMSKFFLYNEVPDTDVADLSRVAGTIELIPTPDGKVCEQLLNTGNFNITPFGTGEKDENGNIKSFNLTGFSIISKKQ